jgi:hypothetical protein
MMTMESMVVPLPSEAVMPFAGFLVADGKFSMPVLILVSTLASITGSLISYYIGALGGELGLLAFFHGTDGAEMDEERGDDNKPGGHEDDRHLITDLFFPHSVKSGAVLSGVIVSWGLSKVKLTNTLYNQVY